jgi:NitT/TauT family transport system substrate-binding protein
MEKATQDNFRRVQSGPVIISSTALTGIVFGLVMWLLLATVISAGAEKALKEASFMPQWRPQAQFAGFYVAFEKGMYRKEGINLTILAGDPRKPPAEVLEGGGVDFATMWLSTGVERHSRGIGLINLAQLIQRSSLMLVAKKGRGISQPGDMTGKKIGVWKGDFQIQPVAFFRKYNLRVTVVPQGYSINLFLRNGIDVASCMWYNEYHAILNAGINPEELSTFFLSDYGLNFPEDGIYMMKKNYQKDPELARAFVRASIEGWTYAFRHPEEALQIVLKYMAAANVPANAAHQRWMLARMEDLILPKNRPKETVGILDRSDFRMVSEEMKTQRLINVIPAFEGFAMNCIAYAQK